MRPHPPDPYYPPGYYAPPDTGPSVATAAIATVVGIVSGLYLGFFATVYILVLTTAPASELDQRDWVLPYLVLLAAGWLISAVVLIVGAILLILRKPFARWLIAVGFVVSFLLAVVPTVLKGVLDEPSSDIMSYFSMAATDGFAIFLLSLAIAGPVGTTVLAFLPATTRYCAERGRPVP